MPPTTSRSSRRRGDRGGGNRRLRHQRLRRRIFSDVSELGAAGGGRSPRAETTLSIAQRMAKAAVASTSNLASYPPVTSVAASMAQEAMRSARLSALRFGACSIINIKPGRVGSYLTAKEIHDLCLSRGAPVWAGGMLETGVGRAANVALAALPGFTLTAQANARAIINPGGDRDIQAAFALHAP